MRANCKIWFPILLAAACQPGASDPEGSSSGGGKADGIDDDGSSLAFDCFFPGDGEPLEVVVRATAAEFQVQAASDEALLFAESGLRPTLNVRVEDGASDVPNEYISFKEIGLEVIPVTSLPRIEISLGSGPDRALVYEDSAGTTELGCAIDSSDLVDFLGLTPVSAGELEEALDAPDLRVGFDVDDTLMFTSPTFARGFATGGTPRPDDVLFWTHTNGCDAGCEAETITLPDGTTKALPANAASTASTAKEKALELIAFHQEMGHEVFAITARPDINGDPLRAYLAAELGIPADHIYFEPDIDRPGNPAGKTDRMESLELDVFYGDSDSDISDAMKVESRFIWPIRFQRSPRSSNRKDGKLNKYHPGYFEELIVEHSYE